VSGQKSLEIVPSPELTVILKSHGTSFSFLSFLSSNLLCWRVIGSPLIKNNFDKPFTITFLKFEDLTSELHPMGDCTSATPILKTQNWLDFDESPKN